MRVGLDAAGLDDREQPELSTSEIGRDAGAASALSAALGRPGD
jgi:hypothetical protein